MIDELDSSLKMIVTQKGMPSGFGVPTLPDQLANVTVSFARPSDPFSVTGPTVNLFLYDVREDLELRSNEPDVSRSNGKLTITPPPRRVLCSYLATAWPTATAGQPDLAMLEHRMLAQLLAVLARYPVIPPEVWHASNPSGTVDLQAPVPLRVALGAPGANPSEFWTAIGNKLRASLLVQATIPLVVADPVPQAIARTHRVVAGVRRPPPDETIDPSGQDPPGFVITGRVTLGGAPVAGASVQVVERGIVDRTAADGTFWLGPLAPGTYTLSASAPPHSGQAAGQVPAAADKDYDIALT